MGRKGKDYASRNQFLRELGFRCYAEYLRSSLWRTIRDEVYRLKGRDCFLCGAPATAVHHNRYHMDDLCGKQMRHVNPICGKCHREIEFNSGEKLTLRQAKGTYDQIRHRYLKDNPERRWDGVVSERRPMPSGPRKGQIIRDAPEDYLRSVLSGSGGFEPDESFRASIEREFSLRPARLAREARKRAKYLARKAERSR